MHKELIIAAFEKARTELQQQGVKEPSNHQVAIRISDFMEDEVDFPITKRSITSYYKSAITSTATEDINLSQNKVVHGLCHYLGFYSYDEFIKRNDTDGHAVVHKTNQQDGKQDVMVTSKDKKVSTWFSTAITKKQILTMAVVILVGIGFIIYQFSNATQWMIWNGNRYEEADFNKEEFTNGIMKVYGQDEMDTFKKINNPDCSYPFFTDDGRVNVWYGKNNSGDVEWFTNIGLHPETGKSLKPITVYMIRKYVCDSY